MFTGIIEETGQIKKLTQSEGGIRMDIQTQSTGKDLRLGGSLAVNGCCLTATKLAGSRHARRVSVDLLIETWSKTNLQHLTEGSLVNLERPLKADGRFDGHMVAGHIEGTGKITRWTKVGQDRRLEITPPKSLMRYIVPKGSIAIDGISLTVAEVLTRRFRVWIIPHTLGVTNLREAKQGGCVNLETDILGKYVERLLDHRREL
ncbi:MAG: Riboflavin synthase [Verrucomicrobia subdivision 3 bacterium]|nr:Riboflavin synthase [Limisphaerales bacterium]MCS1412718.1 Riboflavin synthase [Limisphaerales bacterium]